MAGLGKMAASVFSATNENTLALGSLKLDCSIIKYEAPVEFSGLGAALSTRRRMDALSITKLPGGSPHCSNSSYHLRQS